MSTFGERLTELREAANIRQYEFAGMLHVSAGTVSNYESGRHTPDYEMLVTIADYFHVSVDYLLGRTDIRTPIEELEKEYIDGVSLWRLMEKVVALMPSQRRTVSNVIYALYQTRQTEPKGE